jgi:hypothetical protein
MNTRGTNYYIKGTDQHIGKSNYGGLFCWKCKNSLSVDGVKGLYSGEMLNNCPFCGDRYQKSDFLNNFKEAKYFERKGQHQGIQPILVFRWAIKPYELLGSAPDTISSKIFDMLQDVKIFENGEEIKQDMEMIMSEIQDVEIYDEYGKEYSLGEFREEVLQHCAIYEYSIGEIFC